MKKLRLALLPLALALLAGCSSPSAPAEVAALTPAPAPAAAQGPVPGSTSTPAPGSWSTVTIPTGLTLELVAAAPSDDAETAAAIEAVQAWADTHGAELVVTRGAEFERLLAGAAAAAPSAVITVGPTALDAVDRVSASNAGQPFLLLGAQLPEPTGNVAAVVWPGASSRDTDYGQATGFAGHAASAIALGIAAVVEERTGTVFDLGS